MGIRLVGREMEYIDAGRSDRQMAWGEHMQRMRRMSKQMDTMRYMH